MMIVKGIAASLVLIVGMALAASHVEVLAHSDSSCSRLPSYSELKAAMIFAAGPASGITGDNRGLGHHMWGTIVNRDGVVCAVVFTGANRGAQWPGSRVISAQKANTANAFSLDTLALSTANLYGAVQPGGSLFGLQESNPVDTDVAYRGPSQNYGRPNDPMVGEKIGGVNVFGGGLALYKNGKVIGGLGTSGDTSCADHNIAWVARQQLELDGTPSNDNISYAAGNHPLCAPGVTPPA
jgi:uncharacterized protein GlcG (DUF336 family)